MFLDLFDLHQGVVDFYFLCLHDIQLIEFNTVQKENHMELSLLIAKFGPVASYLERQRSSNVAMYIRVKSLRKLVWTTSHPKSHTGIQVSQSEN